MSSGAVHGRFYSWLQSQLCLNSASMSLNEMPFCFRAPSTLLSRSAAFSLVLSALNFDRSFAMSPSVTSAASGLNPFRTERQVSVKAAFSATVTGRANRICRNKQTVIVTVCGYGLQIKIMT